MRRWCWALAWAWAGAAQAGDVLTFETRTSVEHGKETPQVIFHAAVAGQMDVRIACGSKKFQKYAVFSSGDAIAVDLAGLPEGTTPCEGTVTVVAADGSDGELGFTFSVSSLPLIRLSATMEDYDRAAGALRVHASRGVRSATATVYGAGGRVLATVSGELSDPAAPRLSWGSVGEVLKVVVTVEDEHGFSSELEVFPWYYAVPHEDVVFASNSAEIGAGEVPKLERTWSEVQAVVAKFGGIAQIKLFVAGYTDTVGDASSNQSLSERRAAAIATWFRSAGFRGEIAFQGFGEDALAVATGDGVEESANRRAVYLLAADRPPVSRDVPRASWKRL